MKVNFLHLIKNIYEQCTRQASNMAQMQQADQVGLPMPQPFPYTSPIKFILIKKKKMHFCG